MTLTRSLLAGCFTASSVLLVACGTVGDGNGPVSASIRAFGGATDITTARTFVCLPTSYDLIVTFTNGERGSYGSQTRWTSSDPTVAVVSNGDVADPSVSGTFFARGVVVPKKEGTTTITGRYLNFVQTLTVTVGTVQNVQISPTELNLAVGSAGTLVLQGDLDGVRSSLPALWSFPAPNDSVATINAGTGVVRGVATGSLTARAALPNCDVTRTAPVEVSPLQSIALTQEFAGNSNLVVGTSQLLTATGTLTNGKTQDLTTQVTYTSTDASRISPLFLSPGFVVALQSNASPIGLTASFGSPAVTSPAVNLLPVDATLASLAITPTTATIAPGGTQRFEVDGSYTNGLTQRITRHVNFASSDAAAVVVATNAVLAPLAGNAINPFAGLAGVPTSATAGATATITASHPNLTSSAVATVTVGTAP